MPARARKRPAKARQKVVTDVAPEIIERFAKTIAEWGCHIGHPKEVVDGSREMGGEYIASIAEQRPRTIGHGYPAGQPDWDQPERLWFTWNGIRSKSIVMPDWMALPLVRRIQAKLAERAALREAARNEKPLEDLPLA